jgi:hypothetical protein
MRKRSEPKPDPAAWLSVSKIALKWGCSTDKVFRAIEAYRNRRGFLDLGTPADLKKHTRRSSFIRISPELLTIIEADAQGKVS